MGTIYGLTESEAQARRKQGLGNNTASGPSRSYWDIAQANLFTLFNNILTWTSQNQKGLNHRGTETQSF
jgi:hypothetical protein